MAKFITLNPQDLKEIRNIDERLVSYNIEMTEVTGGTFWKEYTEAQIAGKEDFPASSGFHDFTAAAELMQYYPPINLYDEKLRRLASALSPSWIRVSGSWATKTYYDFDGSTGGKAPEGYQSVLTKEQWIGVLDFVKAVNGKLLVSVSNCAGDHEGCGALDLKQTKKLFDFSAKYGVKIDAAEFMNEPNMLEYSGAPRGYTAKDYARDQDIFNAWVKENYPSCLLVGPCSIGDAATAGLGKKMSAGMGNVMGTCSSEDLLKDTKIKLDVFSYHYYNGISERIASMMPSAHWSPDEASGDEYLAVATESARDYSLLRDKFVPHGQMWVTESGDAGGGGNTWASTFLDVFRTLNELGGFCTVSDGIIFHNTLASSDYGFLDKKSFDPRPNYFAVLLWKRLMGEKVYECENHPHKETHIYCHSRKDGKDGVVYLIINNSKTDILSLTLPKDATRYTLSCGGILRSHTMYLNGSPLFLDAQGNPPALDGVSEKRGTTELPPSTCTFLVM